MQCIVFMHSSFFPNLKHTKDLIAVVGKTQCLMLYHSKAICCADWSLPKVATAISNIQIIKSFRNGNPNVMPGFKGDSHKSTSRQSWVNKVAKIRNTFFKNFTNLKALSHNLNFMSSNFQGQDSLWQGHQVITVLLKNVFKMNNLLKTKATQWPYVASERYAAWNVPHTLTCAVHVCPDSGHVEWYQTGIVGSL